MSSSQLLTCRYWAFGPRCPDIHSDDVQTCRYAHWDTGHLASFYEQRGTCYEWFHKRFCVFGVNCCYEHRDTGVLGLNQGRLVLHGLNLEIADAANRSGFNTRNQVALMDLIWAVRRIAFRHAVERPQIERPPKHPIYPDRYRPGKPADTTRRSRKRRRGTEVQDAGAVTFKNSFDISKGDSEALGALTAASSSAKRLKLNAGKIGRHKVDMPSRAKTLNPVHASQWQNSAAKCLDRGCTNTRPALDMPLPRSLNLPAPRPSSVVPIFHNPLPLLPKYPDITVVELKNVGKTLKDNNAAVAECGKVMKAMYNRDGRLADDVIYHELTSLKSQFDSYSQEAEAGIRAIERVIRLLIADRNCAMRIDGPN